MSDFNVETREDGKWSVQDRWIVDPTKKHIILFSKEFDQAALACTYAVDGEWGGYILGDYFSKDGVDVIVCEEPLILGQARSGASFDIKDEAVVEFMKSDKFMELYGVRKLKNIGWIHSHASMGTFWSGTDNDTTKHLTGNFVISMVVSREGEGIKHRIRVDRVTRFFGGALRYAKDEIDDNFVYHEMQVSKVNEVPDDIKTKYKEILDKSLIIEKPPEQPKQYCYGGVYRNPNGSFAGWDDDYGPYGGHMYTYHSKTEITSESFFRIITMAIGDNEKAVPYDVQCVAKNRKMKKIVKVLPMDNILGIIERCISHKDSIQAFHANFSNFDSMCGHFLKEVKKRAGEEPELKNILVTTFGEDWQDKFKQAIVEDKTKKSDLYIKVEEEKKNWADDALELSGNEYAAFITSIIGAAPTKEESKKMLEKLQDHITYIVRAEEDRYAVYFADTYKKLMEISKTFSNDFHEAMVNFIWDAFETFFTRAKKTELQKVVNALPDELVMPFMHDFIADFENETDLVELYTKGEIPVYRKMYECPICRTVYESQEEYNKCLEECKKKFSAKPAEVIETEEPKSTVPTYPTSPFLATPTGNLGMDSSTQQLLTENDVHSDVGVLLETQKWDVPDQCPYCGRIYETSEGAEMCKQNCALRLGERKSECITIDSLYVCPTCGARFVPSADSGYIQALNTVYDHGKTCTENGAMLFFDLVDCFSGSKREDWCIMLAKIIARYDNVVAIPGIIGWISGRIESGKSFFSCERCHTYFDDSSTPSEKVANMIATYVHETNTCLTDMLPVIISDGHNYYCAVCEKTTNTRMMSNSLQMVYNHLIRQHLVVMPARFVKANVAGGVQSETAVANTVKDDEKIESTDEALENAIEEDVLMNFGNEIMKLPVEEQYLELRTGLVYSDLAEAMTNILFRIINEDHEPDEDGYTCPVCGMQYELPEDATQCGIDDLGLDTPLTRLDDDMCNVEEYNKEMLAKSNEDFECYYCRKKFTNIADRVACEQSHEDAMYGRD